MKRAWLAGLIGLALLLAACGESDCPGSERYRCAVCPEGTDCSLPGVALRFEVRSTRGGFFAKPWPADARLSPDGHLDLVDFPNPAPSSLLDEYLRTAEAHTLGFGTNAAAYMAFDGELDPDSLPGRPDQTLAADSPLFLLDVSDGPGRGQRVPLALRWLSGARQFTPAHTLVARPVLGFPLRPATRYALVLTRQLRGADGRPLGAGSDFERTKYLEPPADEGLRVWWQLFQPVYQQLEQAGVERSEVAGLTVFTTQDVLGEMLQLRDAIAAGPRPQAGDWALRSAGAEQWLFEGWFEIDEFQAGAPPDFDGGGGLVFDADGHPVAQRHVRIPFTLATPVGAPPAGGWPLVLYAHGTGGDRDSFADSAEDVSLLLARLGLASMGIDQPLHGARNPWGRNPEITTFNPYNILAMRDNFRQGAADVLQQRRLAEALVVPAAVSPSGQAIPLDPQRVAFMGHSQGSLNGPLALAVSADIAGGVFSGSGGGLGVAILEKTEPVDIRSLIVLGLGLVDSELDLDHPVLNVFQAFAEKADPLNYAPALLLEPPAGAVPKHVLFTQGLLDVYALPAQAAAMAAAAGCAPLAPLTQAFEPFELRGVEPLPAPVSGNAPGPGGESLTAVMTQYPSGDHFSVFRLADAKRHYTGFLDGLLHDPPPSVGP